MMNVVINVRLFAVIGCACLFSVVDCSAATNHWVAGAGDGGNWSRPGNWSPVGVPQNGDDLIFEFTEEEPFPVRTMHNDLVIVSGQITGTGNVSATIDAFIESRENSLRFDGPNGNTFSGKLTVRRLYHDKGDVIFDKQSGVVVNDALLIGDRSSVISRPAVCRLGRRYRIGNADEVCVTGGSQFLLDGHAETIGSLCLKNNSTDTAATLVDTGGATLYVQGDITAVNYGASVVPTIRGVLGLLGPVPAPVGRASPVTTGEE